MDLKCKKLNIKDATDKLENTVFYTLNKCGINYPDGYGLGIKVCIIDTGFPDHKDIKVNESMVVNFTSSVAGAKDIHGHSTGVSGILCSQNDKAIRGIIPGCSVYFAKGIDDQGEGDYGAIIASVLWAIVKRVDVIIMPFGSMFFNPTLHDVIKKAFNSGICVIASSGNHAVQTHDADYPARFQEVLCVGYSSDIETEKASLTEEEYPSILLPYKPYETTFLQNKFIKMQGTSCFAPVIGSVAVLVIEDFKRRRIKNYTPRDVYREIFGIINK